MSGFTRKVEFTPPYDKRDPSPSKNYGIGSLIIRFVLVGEKGATQFVMATGCYPLHVHKEWERQGRTGLGPMGYDVGYHSPHPMYEGQSATENCAYLNGAPCYYDGSGLAANDLLARFLEDGEDVVWAELESVYRSRFVEVPRV